jgi:membrane protein DedA with SNARE-associated domain
MIPLHVDNSFGPLLQVAVIILATFASEDLTCITVGLLIGSNRLDAVIGLSGCFLGIFVGDVGLWLIGYLVGLGLLRLPLVGRLFPAGRSKELRRWLDERGAVALITARFLPGARLPLYLASGLLGLSLRRFAYWTFLAALLWTPALVILAALLGETIVQPVVLLLGPGWPAILLAALALLLAIRVCTLACTATGRGKLMARVSRLWRWEFWPSWLFYLPVLPWLAYLSLRYRGVLTWTAANPGIPQGGVVGESKYAILTQLPGASVVPSFLVPPGKPGARLAQVRQAIDDRGWSFPLILKPDAAQRGAGVRRVRDLVDVEQYLRRQQAPVIVQTYHPGPFEAGIFYYRLPGEENGHIFSITDKVFPVLVGDGRSTLEELIWRHPRYRMQARTFLARHDAERGRVLAASEPFVLALAGNHCQGTMFRDGAHLITPELERAVDAIARQFPGFYIGRFDVRYTDVAAFQAGRDLAIVELNGATSESTNLYDPSWSLFAAYRTLFRQWSLLYRIGDANRVRGHAPTAIRELLRLVFGYYRGLRVDPLAD